MFTKFVHATNTFAAHRIDGTVRHPVLLYVIRFDDRPHIDITIVYDAAYDNELLGTTYLQLHCVSFQTGAE